MRLIREAVEKDFEFVLPFKVEKKNNCSELPGNVYFNSTATVMRPHVVNDTLLPEVFVPTVKLGRHSTEVFLPSLNVTRMRLIHESAKKDFEFVLPFKGKKESNFSELLDYDGFNETSTVIGWYMNYDTLCEVFVPMVKLGRHSTEVFLPSLNTTNVNVVGLHDIDSNIFRLNIMKVSHDYTFVFSF